MKKTLQATLIFCLLFVNSYATHLMGGQITVRQINGLDYEITMEAYRDTSGIPINPNASLKIDDVNSAFTVTNIASHTGMNTFLNGVEIYKYIDTVTFPATGQYRISWEDCCRNGAILNMANPLSEPMHFMTEITVDAAGLNSSPVFLNPPILLAQKFSMFQYNPLPFDADGDSLAWLMETPLGSGGDTVTGYTIPHADPLNPFTLNPLTGELTWMPDSNGHWEASFRVEEFRGGVKIGEIRRDMQIIVVDDTTNWHNLVFDNGSWPQDMQGNYYMNVPPGVPFNLTVNITDQDNDALALSVQGEPMILTTNPAQWSIISNVPGSVDGLFSWTPSQAQARTMPYILALRGLEFHNQNTFTSDQTLLLRVAGTTGIKNINQDFEPGKLFPNPNSGSWMLSFELQRASRIRIDVSDVLGRVNTVFTEQELPAGVNLIERKGVSLKSGNYIAHIWVNGKSAATYPFVVK